MKRVQSAKPASIRLKKTQTDHQQFSAFLKQLVPITPWSKGRKREDADILMDLRRYRLSGSIGIPPTYSTTNFASFKKGILVSPKETPSRPASSPSKHVSILQTARSLDTLPPTDPNFPSAVQEDSNLRLHNGSRTEINPRPETLTNPLFKFSDMVDKSTAETTRIIQIEKERKTHENYLKSLRTLKSIAFEMNINYEIAHGKEGVTEEETSQLGAYYRLLDEMQTGMGASIEELLLEWRQGLDVKLVNYTKMVRSMLRGLRLRGLDNECILMELIWKLIVKMFDTALELHQHLLDQTVESAKNMVKIEMEKRRKETRELTEKLKIEKEQFQAKLAKMEIELNKAEKERELREKELAEREEELARLTDVHTRENALNEMQHIYRKLNAYLSDSALEQTRQAAALEGVEVLMNAAKRIQARPGVKSVSSQTSDG